MDWNEYRKEHENARFDPDFSQRVLEKASSMQECRKEQITVKHTHIARRGLIAAVLVLALCVTAFAAALTNWELVRQHLGLGKDETVSGLTDFREETHNDLTLVSSLRSGSNLTIYVEASPIQIDRRFETLSGLKRDKEVLILVDHASHFWTEVLEYDPETETALVSVTISDFDTNLDTLTDLELTLQLRNYAEIEKVYGPITVPVTKAGTLNAYFDIPFTSDAGEGHFTHAEVGATSIEIYYTFPEYSTWEKAAPWLGDDEQSATSYLEPLPEWFNAYADAYNEFLTAWSDATCGFVEDARLEFADGTSLLITDDTSHPQWGGLWYPRAGAYYRESTSDYVNYFFGNALDLTQITGITIGGITYPLIPAE